METFSFIYCVFHTFSNYQSNWSCCYFYNLNYILILFLSIALANCLILIIQVVCVRIYVCFEACQIVYYFQHNFPITLEALVLHVLSPMGGEVLTRKLDVMHSCNDCQAPYVCIDVLNRLLYTCTSMRLIQLLHVWSIIHNSLMHHYILTVLFVVFPR